MPSQLKRLIPLFVFFIGLFLVIRHFLIPESFGQYGHYRGNSLQDNADREMIYADREDCLACHSDIQEKLENKMHAGLSCLICHGPGRVHAEDPQPGNINKESGREFCGRCHNTHPSRPVDVVFQVDIQKHHIEIENCIECHNPHELWEVQE